MMSQWRVRDGAYSVTQAVLADVEEASAKLAALPEDVYEHAPGAYVQMVLDRLHTIAQAAEWGQRCLIDEVAETKTLSMRKAAQAAGVAYSTVQRWADSPLLEVENEIGDPVTGPGTLRDADGRSGTKRNAT